MAGTVFQRGEAIRDFLRRQTHEEHERLHRHSHFSALLDGKLDLAEYRRLICRLHGFYEPLDAAILAALPEPAAAAGYSYVSRSGFLAQDMEDLGVSRRDIERTATFPSVAGIVTPATLGGVLYVVEGATLGGARLDRVSRGVLGHQEVAGRRFWAWCRSVNTQRWAMTNRYLEHLHNEGAAPDDLGKGARDTFRMIAEWLSPLDAGRVETEMGSV